MILAAVVALLLIGFSLFSIFEWHYEPSAWKATPGYMSYYGGPGQNQNFPQERIGFSNFSEYGNSVSLGYLFNPGGGNINNLNENENISGVSLWYDFF